MRLRVVALAILAVALVAPLACSGYSAAHSAEAQLSFGVDMARRGLWSEALFRFAQADRLDPNNPRILNNLAVAHEATGDFEKALDSYQRALKLAPADRDLRRNYSRFVEFYQAYRGGAKGEEGESEAGKMPKAGEMPKAGKMPKPPSPKPPSPKPPSPKPPQSPPPDDGPKGSGSGGVGGTWNGGGARGSGR